jgi:hypothetical protein
MEGVRTMKVVMDKFRETKNMIRYESGDERVPTLYVDKKTWTTMPDSIVVTVEEKVPA